MCTGGYNYPSMSVSTYAMKFEFAPRTATPFEVMTIGDAAGWFTGVTGV